MNKKLFKMLGLILGFLSIVSCGGGDGSDDPVPTPQPIVNKPPSIPTQSAPINNLLCIDNNVTFKWTNSTDPDGDSISYEIQIATDNQFTQNVQNNITNSTGTLVSLSEGVAYYWRVRAKDSKGETSNYSSIFSFYTEGEGVSNHVPFSPSISKPELNSLVQEVSTSLEWTASDVDNDMLNFDVYFGTVNPPITKIAENQSNANLTVNLEASKNYYWKVVVKDGNGGQTIGQVWSFKTD